MLDGAVYNPLVLILPVSGLMVHAGLVPRFAAVNCCVWEALRDAVVGLTAGDADVVVFRVIVAWAVCEEFAVLVTVSVMVCCEAMVLGAVYTPFVIVPTEGLSDHVTAVVAVPPSVTLNCADWPPVRDTEEGVIASVVGARRVIVALADLVVSAALTAVIVTVCWAVIV